MGAREHILELIDELNLKEDVLFIDYVSEEDLPKRYNAQIYLFTPVNMQDLVFHHYRQWPGGTPVITSKHNFITRSGRRCRYNDRPS